MIDLSEKVWQNEEVERGLRQLPALIARKSVEMAGCDAKVKQLKHSISLIEAIEMTKETQVKRTPTEMKAAAYVESQEQRVALIELELKYALLESEHQELKDMFDSIRKQANVMIEEIKRNI